MLDIFPKFAFVVGISIGILLFCVNVKKHKKVITMVHSENKKCIENIYNEWFQNENNIRNISHYRNKLYSQAEYLFDKVKVLCVILMYKLHNGESCKTTWARSCNKVVYANMTTDAKVKLPITKHRKNSSWSVLCKSLLDIQRLEVFNWILIVKDGTFAVVENLRYMVAGLNDSDSYYLGHGLSLWGTNYNSGDAGYVLSRGTLTKFLNSLKSPEQCLVQRTIMNQEDYYLGKFLFSLGVQPSDTRDCSGYSTFHGYNLNKLFFPGSTRLSNYYKNSLFPVKCCSRYSVTFQATEGDRMYTYFYLLYKLQLFNYNSNANTAASVPEKEVWRSFLESQNIFVNQISPEEYYKVWEKVVKDPKVFSQHLKNENEN